MRNDAKFRPILKRLALVSLSAVLAPAFAYAGPLHRASGATSCSEFDQTCEAEGTLTLIVTLSTNGSGEGRFTFSSSHPAIDKRQISTRSGTSRLGPVSMAAGEYFIRQDSPLGWHLDKIVCSGDVDKGSSVDIGQRTLTLDLDVGENIRCLFVNRADRVLTKQASNLALHDFLTQRADRIVSASPDLQRRFSRRIGRNAQTKLDLNLRGTRTEWDGQTSLSAWRRHVSEWREDQWTAYLREQGELKSALEPGTTVGSMDIWLSADYASVNKRASGDDSSSSFGMYYLGGDVLLSKNFLLGALVQVDRTTTAFDNSPSEVTGTGFLGGPYAVWRIAPRVYLDARMEAGRAENISESLGAYGSNIASSRWLAETNLVGKFGDGDWWLQPKTGFVWYDEQSDAYTDRFGLLLPAQNVQLGRLRAGPAFGYDIEFEDGTRVSPRASFTANWDMRRLGLEHAPGYYENLGRFRADSSLGVSATLTNGVILSGTLGLDGIGEGQFQARQFGLDATIPLKGD